MSYTRKEFMKIAAVLSATVITGSSFVSRRGKPRLAFSTIACPDWSFQQIVDFAALQGYEGIEMRGVKRELDLLKCAEFDSPQHIRETIALMKSKSLKFTDLGSSAQMHHQAGPERDKNIADAKAFIDLAQALDCPYVRVFPNHIPKERDRNEVLDTIAKNLLVLGDYAKDRKVTVLMETHGDLSRSADIERVMRAATHKNIGLVWDISNMWTVTKEPPAEVYGKLKEYIRHTHLKDAKLSGDTLQYVFVGKGDVPVFEAIDILVKGGYRGYYCFEWEKLWHKELAEPELALADYMQAMKKHFG